MSAFSTPSTFRRRLPVLATGWHLAGAWRLPLVGLPGSVPRCPPPAHLAVQSDGTFYDSPALSPQRVTFCPDAPGAGWAGPDADDVTIRRRPDAPPPAAALGAGWGGGDADDVTIRRRRRRSRGRRRNKNNRLDSCSPTPSDRRPSPIRLDSPGSDTSLSSLSSPGSSQFSDFEELLSQVASLHEQGRQGEEGGDTFSFFSFSADDYRGLPVRLNCELENKSGLASMLPSEICC